MSEWGNPAGVMPCHAPSESIGGGEPTGGTETSNYPQEKKSKEIPLVAASERGTAQTGQYVQAGVRCTDGVAGPTGLCADESTELQTIILAEKSGKSCHRR